MQDKKKQLKLTWKNRLVQIGKGVCQSCILSSCLFNIYRVSCEIPEWMKHKLKSRFVEEKSITSGMQMAPSLWQKAILKLLKSLLMRVKEQSEKAGLKLIIQNTKLMASGPITSWQKMGKQWKQRDFIFLGSKSTQMVTAVMILKDACSLQEKLQQTTTAY